MPSPAPESDIPLPPEWQPGMDALRTLPDGGTVLLLGATDRGKTTFAAAAARALASEFERVAVIDADVGQSEIGPPGTVGVAWAAPDAAKLHDMKTSAAFFVGAFAPAPVALELVVATAQAAEWARACGARRLLIDTTGFVAGPAARRLKVAKAQAVRPSLILGFQRDGELGGLLSVIGAATGAPAIPLAVPEAVGRKSTALRQTRRLGRLSKALQNAQDMPLSLPAIATVGATLGTGEPIPPHLARWAGTALRLPVVHAEKAEGALTVFLSGTAPRPGWEAGAGPVAEHFGARTVRAISLAAHADALLGLHDGSGHLLSLGRFLRLDPERAEITVAAPLASPAARERIRLVAFGRVRVAPDGATLSEIKPGEL